jgi:hypothetical protein
MSRPAKRPSSLAIGTAIRSALRSTQRSYLPFGVFVALLSSITLISGDGLVGLIGAGAAGAVLVVTALLGQREHRALTTAETLNAIVARFGGLATTLFVSLLFGLLLLVPLVALFALAVAALLSANPALAAFLAALPAAVETGAPLSAPPVIAMSGPLPLLGGGLLLAALVLYTYVGLRTSFVYYATIDGLSGVDAFRRSWTITGGAVFRVLVWSLISALIAFGISTAAIVLSPAGTVPLLIAAALTGAAGSLFTAYMNAQLYLDQKLVHGMRD